MKKFLHASCIASVIIAAGTAHADIINIEGNLAASAEQTGANFTGTIAYAATNASAGVVTIMLNNTTPANIGGFLTGFAFNIGSTDTNATAALASATNANFLDLGSAAASPFGTFDAGAALGANWQGGGSPAGGIPIGGSATFTFDIAADDALSLTSQSFLTGGPNAYNFIVRFRGLENGGSDKVPAIPAPGVGAFGAMAMLGLGLRRRR